MTAITPSSSRQASPDFRLCEAILDNDIVAAAQALQDGANPDFRDRDDPAAWRLFSRQLKSVPILYEAATMSSARMGRGNDPSITRLLLQWGANPNAADDFGYTALHQAASCNNTPVMQALIQAGADINICSKRGYTPVYTAVHMRSPEALSLLIRHGARLDVRNNDGLSPEAYAQRIKRLDLVALIEAERAYQALRDVADQEYGAMPELTPLEDEPRLPAGNVRRPGGCA